jgi:hypothetical protein
MRTRLSAKVVLAAAAVALIAAPAAAGTQAAAGTAIASVPVNCPPPTVSDPGSGGC